MTLGLWLCLFSFVIVLFPEPLLLRKFQKQYGSPVGKESFKAFQFLDVIWMIVCLAGFGWALVKADGYSAKFSLMAMCLALITIPIALYSGLTGIYPARSRIGYYYFRQYKDPAKKFLMSSKYSEVKVIGWLQFFFLIGIVAFSAGYLFW